MRAPRFWWREPPTLEARLLAPVGFLYGAIAARRLARPGLGLGVPVICVGNVTLGGAGKTPTALHLAERLEARGERPAFLSRGYGRETGSQEVIAVDPAIHTARIAGDEPLLLARTAPCFVGADRTAAARAALAAGATALVMDDGLQNPALAKTASVVVVDGATGIGNGATFPAGPLRAPLGAQWPLASAVLIIGDGASGEAVAKASAARGIAVGRGRLRPQPASVEALRGRPLVAFAGLGRPEKFFATLRDGGLDVVETRGFPDHHPFRAEDLHVLRRRARQLGADLVTTEKDAVRLPASFEVATLPVRLAPDDDVLETVLDRALSSSRKA